MSFPCPFFPFPGAPVLVGLFFPVCRPFSALGVFFSWPVYGNGGVCGPMWGRRDGLLTVRFRFIQLHVSLPLSFCPDTWVCVCDALCW